uniref:Voltagegated Ion Channel (VIC) Superfamily putative n=1 Tax=Albugo laibachii Nc14 TaxID=890382 RepID=F0W9Q0_9STRA|nr:Voltagegated Ion Channel (VIC) Superfamily putative [Albugo laibachii Nc14]|eukprot:CCA17868.1 Voltagegated Ion Channel (VIC) Superfamily putative [Albugo laibachii Nc14]
MPNHIVVCSFLGEEALSSLQWFILPLRLAHAIDHPTITILDAAEPSALFCQLQAFKNIVCAPESHSESHSACSITCKEAHLFIPISSALVQKQHRPSLYSAKGPNQRHAPH